MSTESREPLHPDPSDKPDAYLETIGRHFAALMLPAMFASLVSGAAILIVELIQSPTVNLRKDFVIPTLYLFLGFAVSLAAMLLIALPLFFLLRRSRYFGPGLFAVVATAVGVSIFYVLAEFRWTVMGSLLGATVGAPTGLVYWRLLVAFHLVTPRRSGMAS